MTMSGERHEWQEPGHRWFDFTLLLAYCAFALVVWCIVVTAMVKARIVTTYLRKLRGEE